MPGDGFTPAEQAAIAAAVAAGKCRRVEYRPLLPSKESAAFDRDFYLRRHAFLASRGVDSQTAPVEIIALALNEARVRSIKGSDYSLHLAGLLKENCRRALDEQNCPLPAFREEASDRPRGRALRSAPGYQTPRNINSKPLNRLYPMRAGTIIAKLVDLLARPEGASVDELLSVCIKRDGTQWKYRSLVTAIQWDLKNAGYGVRTEGSRLYLVLPEGCSIPPHTQKKDLGSH